MAAFSNDLTPDSLPRVLGIAGPHMLGGLPPTLTRFSPSKTTLLATNPRIPLSTFLVVFVSRQNGQYNPTPSPRAPQPLQKPAISLRPDECSRKKMYLTFSAGNQAQQRRPQQPLPQGLAETGASPLRSARPKTPTKNCSSRKGREGCSTTS